MQCPTCFGHRLFYFQGVYLPCPDCEGNGILHCCDGLQAQPEHASKDSERHSFAAGWHAEETAWQSSAAH